MAEEGFRRKLTAILSADVEGYSRLMGEDEDATIRTLTAYRELMSTLIQKQHGRVVDSPGDNLLAEFLSVVDAVRCAVEIQEELRVRNAELPDGRRMEFRIGINLGDVVEEGERIYGDGVNITARVEGLAEGGGICISGTVYDSIKSKLSLGYESLGEHTVKNIKEPVRVYRMRVGPDASVLEESKEKKLAVKRWQWAALAAVVVLILGAVAVWNFYFRLPSVEPASVEKMAFPLPEKPSIAVLPFDNMSGDPEQDFIADGFTENIIMGLSQMPGMFVIARNSVFTYKGKPVKIKQVSEELGVRYVLEGSVQKAGDRLRVNAQLIDALKGHHLWADRYDRELKDLFKLQDEITLKVTTALSVKLLGLMKNERIQTDNFEAWSLFTKGIRHFNRHTKEDNQKAIEYFEKALKLDSDYPLAWLFLAWTHLMDGEMGFSDSPGESIKRAVEIKQKTSDLWPEASRHSFTGEIYSIQKQYEKSISEKEKALALAPNSSREHISLAWTLKDGARPEEAIVYAKKAMRLEPHYPAWFLTTLISSYDQTGRYEEGLAACKQLLDRAAKGEYPLQWAHLGLAAGYARLDRMEEARSHAAELLKIVPKFSIKKYRASWRLSSLKDQKYVDSYTEMLRKAGLPDEPPLPLPDKPSIAVLPFKNLSSDPEQEFLSDGFTEDIITTLAKLPRMFVIARESSFTFKGKSVKIQEVGRDLGVGYVLEGSIQKLGDRVRISAKLIDAKNGHHLWAEKFDRDQQDIFKLRDDITKEIAIALQVKLTEGEWLPGWGGITNNFDAYINVRQSLEHFRRFTPDDNILSRQKAKEALKLDPNYSAATQMIAWTLLMDGLFGTSKTPDKSIEQAFELARKALNKGDDDSGAHYLLGYAYLQRGQFEKAVSELEIARELFPNSAEINAGLGMVLSDAGRPMEAIPALKNDNALESDSTELVLR